MATIGTPESTPTDDAKLRAAATRLGLDFDHLQDSEREMVDAFASGRLDSISTARADLDANPLIPIDDTTDDGTPASTSESSDAAPTTPTASDGATTDDATGGGIRTDPAASSGGEGSVGPTGAPPAALAAPDALGSASESGATATGQEPLTGEGAAPAYVEIVDNAGKQVSVPLEQVQYALGLANAITPQEVQALQAIRDGQAAISFVDPQTGQPIPPVGVAPTTPGTPPADEEWDDPRAQAAFATLNTTLAEMQRQQTALYESQVAEQNRVIVTALEASASDFAKTRGLNDDELARLTTAVGQSGLLPVYARQHPGDPRSAMSEALNALYWSDPAFRDRETQRAISEHTTATADVDRKKATAGSVAGAGGSVSRTPPAPSTHDERQRAMVDMIASDMQTNGNGSS